MPIYLDYNATAPVLPDATARMQELMALPTNASSVHSFGREAKKHLEAARKAIAEAISAWPAEVMFTATGTEANITALRGTKAERVLVSAIEHSSVLKAVPQEIIPVTSEGIVDLAKLDDLLAQNTAAALVSVMLANNETGVIQPIAEVAQICKKYGALLHCDAVQALGKIPVDFSLLGVDMLTISAHKCGGPLGAAALVARRDLPLNALLTGGGQELGRRAGTENIPAIAGFAKAIELIDFSYMERLRGWLDAMEREISSPIRGEAGRGAQLGETSQTSPHPNPPPNGEGIVFGKNSKRLPNTSCIAMPGVGNEVQLMDFDLAGFAVSAGSACSSGRIESSHVLAAMGVPKELASCAIRISGGWNTSEDEIKAFTAAWVKTCCRLKKTAVKAASQS